MLTYMINGPLQMGLGSGSFDGKDYPGGTNIITIALQETSRRVRVRGGVMKDTGVRMASGRVYEPRNIGNM